MRKASFDNPKMCDSPVVPSALTLSGVLSKCSHLGAKYRKSVSQVDALDELQSKTQFLGGKFCKDVESPGSSTKSSDSYLYRSQLEQDVLRLQQQLHEEMELHAILEKAIEKDAVELSSPCLPQHAQELLSNLAVLEVTVTKLEDEMVSLHFQLSQERNERRLTEYRMRHLSPEPTRICPSDNMRTPRLSHKKHPISQALYSSDDSSQNELRERQTGCTSGSSTTQMVPEDEVDSVLSCNVNNVSVMHEIKDLHAEEFRRRPRGMPSKGLWDYPNLLSEEMVRCMRNIFISLADSCGQSKSPSLETKIPSSSPRGHFSNSSWWSSERSVISSWVQSPQIDVQNNSDVLAAENAFDPYRVRGKLSWVDIGNYGSATEVSWMSVGKQQLQYASGALRKFRTLVEQLAKVNPIYLSCDEKLAFWINLYNALIMHAYLAYGVPKSDLKLFSLMQKAAYTVGGNSFSAAAIEYVILKMKPPGHRPQIALLLALHKLKVTEEQRKSALDTCEPLVSFALSCGMYSSPVVRIYTPRNIREELQDAQRDFIRASVGVSNKGKLLVPKMIHSFTKGFVDDANLAVWISHFLPPHQAAFVEQCISQRRQSLLGSRNCGILPFDSRFRYLFLPENVPVSN